MHCLEDFRKYFLEIILTEMFLKIQPFENFRLYGKLSGHIAWRQMISKNLLTTTTPAL